METTVVNLYALNYNHIKTYRTASLSGNPALPQIMPLLPQEGVTWLPICFFTLTGAANTGKNGPAYRIFSPDTNALVFEYLEVTSLSPG